MKLGSHIPYYRMPDAPSPEDAPEDVVIEEELPPTFIGRIHIPLLIRKEKITDMPHNKMKDPYSRASFDHTITSDQSSEPDTVDGEVSDGDMLDWQTKQQIGVWWNSYTQAWICQSPGQVTGAIGRGNSPRTAILSAMRATGGPGK